MRKCSDCKKEKDEKEFYKNNVRKDGLGNICKHCSKKRFKEYYEKNKEKIKKKNYERCRIIEIDYDNIVSNKSVDDDRKILSKEGIEEAEVKPWKDPDSLFCDTEFLKSILGKEVEKGKECK